VANCKCNIVFDPGDITLQILKDKFVIVIWHNIVSVKMLMFGRRRNEGFSIKKPLHKNLCCKYNKVVEENLPCI